MVTARAFALNTMVRRSQVSVEDVLHHLDSDACFDCGLERGSDDDLGMHSNYDYDSDSSAEGIIQE